MNPGRHRFVFFAAIVVSAFAARTTPAAVIVPTTAEEERLWRHAGEEQATIDKSGFVIEQPAVDAYLAGVIARLAAPEGLDADAFTIRVLRDPSLNAFAFPNGRLYIHSGLLARMLNEAQLAAVIGHEMTHVTQHHAFKGYRDMKSKTAWLAVATVSAGDYSSLVQLLGGLGTMAAITGYSRGMETEADNVGWTRMLKAGYDTKQAPEVFKLLMTDLQEHQRKEPFFFGTHPRLLDREKNFEKLNASQKASGAREIRADEFAVATLPILLINGELEMRAGRHDAARDQLWRYRAARPEDVRARWILAENERLAGDKGDRAEARKLLAEALLMDPQFAPAHRTLGLICFRAGELPAAAEHLRRFLELEPAAHDRAYLESYIQQCPPPPPASPAS